MNGKVLVCCPTYSGKDYVFDRYIERVKSLTYKNYDILIVDTSKDDSYFEKLKTYDIKVLKGKWDERSKIRMTNAQNMIREELLKGDYTHMLMLESDLIPPKDIIEQLMEHDKSVVSGWYYITKEPRPCLSREWTLVDMKFAQKEPLLVELAKERLYKVFSGSFGCSLIKREVLEKIKFKVFAGFSHHSDTWFYFDCEREGFEVYVDTDLLIPHFQDYKWGDILSRDKEIEMELMKLKLEDGLD